MEIQKGDKKIIKGWVMYDWANSVYNLVISSAIFPIFYDTVTTKQYLSGKPENIGKPWTSLDLDPSKLAAGEEAMVDFFGMHIPNSALMSFVLSASFLIVSFSSPFLS